MEDLSYYEADFETVLNNNVYLCDVQVTGHRDYHPGDGHSSPPEESYHFVEVEVDNVSLITEDYNIKSMNFPRLKNALSSMIEGKDLLAITI